MTSESAQQAAGHVRLGTACGRGVLFATVLGSGISFLDGLVVNVALPRMDKDLHLGIAGLEWTVAGYLLTVSSFLLLGGSLGDLYGRRKIYLTGLAIFVAASMACGLSPNVYVLVGARVVQGIGGAFMIPASLAIIQAVFAPEDRGAAVGAWTGLSAVFTALGPFVGGAFVTFISWRWAFFINLPLGIIAWWASLRWVPESKDGESGARHPDLKGAALAALGLAGVTAWAIEGPAHAHALWPLAVGLVGLALLAMFVLVESRVSAPMMPLSLFKSREFTWVNVCTVLFYGAFVTGITFLGVQLQTNLGYSPLLAGVASLPVNVFLFTLSKRFGAWGQRVGAKYPMTIGPAIVAVALFMMSGVHAGRGYWTYVLPAIMLWGLGLSMTVAPLTAAALAAADQHHIGVASAINNAASRVGQSLFVALIPAAAGIGGSKALGGAAFSDGFAKCMKSSAVLCAVAALVALLFVQGKHNSRPAQAETAEAVA